jgi:CHAT domain
MSRPRLGLIAVETFDAPGEPSASLRTQMREVLFGLLNALRGARFDTARWQRAEELLGEITVAVSAGDTGMLRNAITELARMNPRSADSSTAEPAWPAPVQVLDGIDLVENLAGLNREQNGNRRDIPVRGEYSSVTRRGVSPVAEPSETNRQRYLQGRCPEKVAVGKPFSLLARIVRAPGPDSVPIEYFDVPSGGRDVLLVLHAPELRLLSEQRQTVRVPADADSRPVMFELLADAPGPRQVSITAWAGGSYLGELVIDITAERDLRPGGQRDRDVQAQISTESAEGSVSLVVRYDPVQNAYCFEFRDEDNPGEVRSDLAYDPAPLVEQLVANLDDLAKGRTGYSAGQARDYLRNEGARLWHELVPQTLREQFWERQHRIRQLTILTDKDAVPWELLYPMDRGHDAGFLVEQFPVTRAIFGRRAPRTLNLRPSWFVLPDGSPPEARYEIEAMRRLLDPGQRASEVISELDQLRSLIADGNFGLLHFACHNTYDPAGGSSIRLGDVPFTPTLLTTAEITQALADAAPTIFMNACRSAGLVAAYNRLDGWATSFLKAGAAAFIGSLWAVTDGAAREFAEELYGQLQAGSSLGKAAMNARQAVAGQADDPTWLAYTVYGNPRATVRAQRP